MSSSLSFLIPSSVEAARKVLLLPTFFIQDGLFFRGKRPELQRRFVREEGVLYEWSADRSWERTFSLKSKGEACELTITGMPHFSEKTGKTLALDLDTFQRYPHTKLRLLVTGAHGLVGSYLVPFLQCGGHDVFRMGRGRENDIQWDPERGRLPLKEMEGFDGMIHLAGESLFALRWTKRKKERIFRSRAIGTWLLAEALSRLKSPPRFLLSASAIGFYGPRRKELLVEESTQGEGFLAEVCHRWESALLPAQNQGIRTVAMRFGAVLTPQGGLLGKLVPGVQLGSGKRAFSWIEIDDLVRAIYHLIWDKTLSGPINCTAPEPTIQSHFAKALAKGRVFIKIPDPLLKLVHGEVARELICTSQQVVPERLLKRGFTFRYGKIEDALERVL